MQEKTKTRTKWDIWEVPAGAEEKAKDEKGMDLPYYAQINLGILSDDITKRVK